MGTFKIPVTPPTTNKTIRFPNDVVEAVECLIDRANSNGGKDNIGVVLAKAFLDEVIG